MDITKSFDTVHQATLYQCLQRRPLGDYTLNLCNQLIRSYRVTPGAGLHFLGHTITSSNIVVDRHTTASVLQKSRGRSCIGNVYSNGGQANFDRSNGDANDENGVGLSTRW